VEKTWKRDNERTSSSVLRCFAASAANPTAISPSVALSNSRARARETVTWLSTPTYSYPSELFSSSFHLTARLGTRLPACVR